MSGDGQTVQLNFYTTPENRYVIQFGRSVEWIRLNPAGAREIAEKLLAFANAEPAPDMVIEGDTYTPTLRLIKNDEPA